MFSREIEYIWLVVKLPIFLGRVRADFVKSAMRSVVETVVLNMDSQGTIGLARYPVSHNRSKHISISIVLVRY